MNDEQDRPRVVYDCVVFLQGLIKETGPAVDCLELFEDGKIELFISEAVLNEIGDVLTRPDLQQRFVSRDNDLLDLMKDTEVGKSFRDRFPGLRILNPVAFLLELEQLSRHTGGSSDG